MLFDLGIDRLPCVVTRAGGFFAQSNKSGDVIRASCLAGVRNFPVVTLHLLECTDIPRADGFLRARRERPGHGSATHQRDELAPPHSITSSAVARSVGGTVRPSALALFKLMASSNLTGCSTGRLAGLVPCKILCTYSAARRYKSVRLGPYEMSPPATAFSFTTYIVGNRFFATKSIIHPTCER